MLIRVSLLLGLALVSAKGWAQAEPGAPSTPDSTAGNSQSTSPAAQGPSSTAIPPDQSDQPISDQPIVDQPMTTPSLVSGAGSPLVFTPDMERSNYLRGGIIVTAGYEDHVLSSVSNVGSDETYTIGPTIGLDLTRTRYRLDLFYSPGFTFYQENTFLDQTSHSLGFSFAYRLSPHVTFTALDSFAKTSGVFSPLDYTVDALPNPIDAPNLSLIAPVEDTLINTATVGLSYQFGRNDIVGITGSSSLLRYLDSSQAPGLFDSTSESGGAYYTHRFANRNYLGVNYQFQNFDTEGIELATQAHSIYGFYTLYFKPTFSLTLFGGPEYSITSGGGFPSQQMWSPAGGGTLDWQGKETSFAASFSRRITDGGGLYGAVRAETANASFRAKFTRNVTGSISGSYTDNAILDPVLGTLEGSLNGHTISGSASLQRTFGQHVTGSLGYLHLHQSYGDVPLVDLLPNQNRVWGSISFQFERPLGR